MIGLRTEYCPLLITLLLLCTTFIMRAQLSITAGDIPYTINFDNSIQGVNNGVLNSITPMLNPTAGKLDQAGWSITGSSFSGQSNGGGSVAGCYSYLVNTGSRGLGFQAASNFDYHDVSLVLKNNTSLVISGLTITFKLYAGDPQGRNTTVSYSGSSGSGSSGSETTDNIFSTGTPGVSTWKYVTKTMTVSGLSLQNNGVYTIKWSANRGSGSGNSDEWAIDDIQVTATTVPCSAAASPASNASGLSFSNVDCDQMKLSWTGGSGTNTLIVAGTSPITSSPADGTSYLAGSEFGLGAAVGPGEFVVYNGSGTSVVVSGLNASTIYYFTVYSFNGTGTCVKYYSGLLSSVGQVTAAACTVCPVITGIVIDACNAVCGEGDNEIIYMNSGTYSLNVSPSNFIVNFFLTNSAPQNFTSGITTNSATIAALNSGLPGSCPAGTFIDAAAVGTIPPLSRIMVVRSTFCPSDYDFTSLCGTGPFYVVFSTSAYWTAGGNFGNNGCGAVAPAGVDRSFQVDFSALNPDCKINYQYSCQSLYNGDGAYITPLDPYRGLYTTYSVTGNCFLPLMLLPIELLQFEGESVSGKNILQWSTSSESDIETFVIERSADNIHYERIGETRAKGIPQGAEYTMTDTEPLTGINYYRLGTRSSDNRIIHWSEAVVENLYNGNQVFSAILTAHGIRVIANTTSSHFDELDRFELLDINGRLVQTAVRESEGSFVFDTEIITNGIYMVRMIAGDQVVVHKIFVGK